MMMNRGQKKRISGKGFLLIRFDILYTTFFHWHEGNNLIIGRIFYFVHRVRLLATPRHVCTRLIFFGFFFSWELSMQVSIHI